MRVLETSTFVDADEAECLTSKGDEEKKSSL